jgi:hypothetical protein
MTSHYLDLPRFPLAVTLKALRAPLPSTMLDAPDFAPPSGPEYRQLARRLRELARDTRRPHARRELLRLSGIYERRADYLDRLSGQQPPRASR